MRSQYLEHQGIQISSGNTLNTDYIHKYGAVPSMSQNTTGTIWDEDDTLYPWQTLVGAQTLDITVENALDLGADVIIYGLDENWMEVREIVGLASLTGVTTVNSYRRVYRAYYRSTNSAQITNLGNITMSIGGTTVAKVTAGEGQTLMAVYTVPGDCTMYLTQYVATCQAGADATVTLYIRYDGYSNFRNAHSFEITGTGGQYDYIFTVPLRIPAKSDIELRAKMRTNNARITATFDGILVHNK